MRTRFFLLAGLAAAGALGCPGRLTGGQTSEGGCAQCDGRAPPDGTPPATDRGPRDRGKPDAPPFAPGTPKRLTSHSADDQNPLWSPDGKRIAFTSKRAFGNHDLWTMQSDGTSQKALTALAQHDEVNLPGSAWCAKTDQVVFASDQGGSEDIWVIKADGTGSKRITQASTKEQEPTWSPTCDRIVYQAQRSGNWDIYVARADGTNEQRLTSDTADDWQPNWSPTAETIVFQSRRSGRWKLYLVSSSGGAAQLLGSGSSEDTDASFSPDGKYVVYSTDAFGTGGARIAVRPIQGGAGPIRVTQGNAYDGAPSWSPDGRTIAFESDRSGNLDIWVVTLW